VDFDLEKLLLPEHVWAGLLVSLQLLLQALDLYCQVIDNTSIIICTATPGSGEFWWVKAMGDRAELFFVGRSRFFLEKRRIDFHHTVIEGSSRVLV
jgi:hypothetical protein